METHDNDPTTDSDTDPWYSFQDEVGDLRGRLKDTYRKAATDDGPTEEEIREAFATLLGAWSQVADSVTTALQDPEVRGRLKAAASSLAKALGTTMSELGSELAKSDTGDEEE